MHVILAVFAGLLLSWYQIEGLRRNTIRLLDPAASKSGKWTLGFGLRWGSMALLFWMGLHFFKNNILAFVLSFILSGFFIRHGYARRVYAR